MPWGQRQPAERRSGARNTILSPYARLGACVCMSWRSCRKAGLQAVIQMSLRQGVDRCFRCLASSLGFALPREWRHLVVVPRTVDARLPIDLLDCSLRCHAGALHHPRPKQGNAKSRSQGRGQPRGQLGRRARYHGQRSSTMEAEAIHSVQFSVSEHY